MGVKARLPQTFRRISPFQHAQSFSAPPQLLPFRPFAPHRPLIPPNTTRFRRNLDLPTVFLISTRLFQTASISHTHIVRVSGVPVHRSLLNLQQPRLLQSVTNILRIYHRWRRKTTSITHPTSKISAEVRLTITQRRLLHILPRHRFFTIPPTYIAAAIKSSRLPLIAHSFRLFVTIVAVARPLRSE